jgi:1-acyl-sn-glycerol-3-phosphate acyltransferase
MKQPLKIFVSAMGFTALGIGGILFSLLGLPLLRLLPGGQAGLQRRTRWVIHRFFRAIIRFVVWAGFFQPRVEGLPPQSQRKGLLILATHPGYLDVVLLLSLLEQAICVVKGDIWNNPLFGGVVRSAGYIPALDPIQMVEEGARALARGEVLLLFPEGTRTQPGEPYRFHRGAAHLALKAQARILPILVTCEPPLFAKGHRWYEIPSVSCDYYICALAPLDLPWADITELPSPQAAREVTTWLESRFNQEIHDSSNLTPGDEAVHRQDP